MSLLLPNQNELWLVLHMRAASLLSLYPCSRSSQCGNRGRSTPTSRAAAGHPINCAYLLRSMSPPRRGTPHA